VRKPDEGEEAGEGKQRMKDERGNESGTQEMNEHITLQSLMVLEK
jgi:hypothetical protein